MSHLRRNFIAYIALFIVLGGSAFAAIGHDSAKTKKTRITACYPKKSKVLQVARRGKCPDGYKKLVWNRRGRRGKAGAEGAAGQTGAQGVEGEQGEPGTPGADGVDGTDGTDGAPGQAGLLDSFAGTESNLSVFASTNCSAPGVTVDVTVPPSGLVEVMAVASLQANSNTLNACINSTKVLSTTQLVATTLYTMVGSTTGTTTAANAEWLKFWFTPGSNQAITLNFDLDGGGSTPTVHDQKLIVRTG